MTLASKLAQVQNDLHAPKDQFNNFGGYSYRNCEDILQAVKPLLVLGDLIITISDDIVLVGDRVYVKATATITDGKERISTTAFAREAARKKGMDDSQLTGATSSYARKYALNGLLLIDDNKDADSMDNRQQAQQQAPQQPQQAPKKGKPLVVDNAAALGIVTAEDDDDAHGVICQPAGEPAAHPQHRAGNTPTRNDPPGRHNGSPISEAQHRRLEARISELGLDRERVKSWTKRAWGVEHLNQIPVGRYARLDNKLDEWAVQAEDNKNSGITVGT